MLAIRARKLSFVWPVRQTNDMCVDLLGSKSHAMGHPDRPLVLRTPAIRLRQVDNRKISAPADPAYIARGDPRRDANCRLELSCAAVFRNELLNLFPHDEDAQRLVRQTFVVASSYTETGTFSFRNAERRHWSRCTAINDRSSASRKKKLHSSGSAAISMYSSWSLRNHQAICDAGATKRRVWH